MAEISDIKNFLDRVESEGLEYTVIHYSDWKEIDGELGDAIKAYQQAYENLEKIING